MKVFRYIMVALSWVLAGFVAYLAFGVFAPWICSLIPGGPWKGLLNVVVYFFVASIGGIAAPLTVGVLGAKFATLVSLVFMKAKK